MMYCKAMIWLLLFFFFALNNLTFSYLQAKEDGDKPGLEAMLQKVLQLYASKVLSKRSYWKKGKWSWTSV